MTIYSEASERVAVTGAARALLVGGSLVRGAYGLGAMLAPERMVAARLAPDTHAQSEPRLLLRAFGGHLLVTAGMTLAALRSPPLARRAATASMLVDAFDVACTVLEQHARGGGDEMLTGGYRLSGTGAVTFAAALWTLRRG